MYNVCNYFKHNHMQNKNGNGNIDSNRNCFNFRLSLEFTCFKKENKLLVVSMMITEEL